MSENLPTTPPGYVKIASQVLGAPAAQFDFLAIPATFRHLRMVAALRTDRAVASEAVLVAFNNDAAAANYDGELVQAAAAVATATETLAAAAARTVGLAAAATGQAGAFGVLDLVIVDYANAARLKVAQWQSSVWATRLTGNIIPSFGMVGWANVATVNRVTLTPAVGPNFVAGSSVDLYGAT